MKHKVTIIDPHWDGHHLKYLLWIIEGFVKADFGVSVITSEKAREHPLYKKFKMIKKIKISLIPYNSRLYQRNTLLFNLIIRDLWNYLLLRKLYHREIDCQPFSHILLPYMDYCTYPFALFGAPFGRTPWSGIVMRPPVCLDDDDSLNWFKFIKNFKKKMFYKLLKSNNLGSIFIVDERAADRMEKEGCSSGKIVYLPDPGEMKIGINQDSARKILDIPAGNKLLLVYGAISERKGLKYLINSMHHRSFPKGLHIAIAGKQDGTVESLLNQKNIKEIGYSDRIHIINNYLNDEMETALFSASDFVWVGYHKHNTSSGILVQAGQMGLPVIGCNTGTIGYAIRKYSLGMTVDIHSPREIAHALSLLCSNTGLVNSFGNNGRAKYEKQSPEVFTKTLISRIIC